MAVGAVAFELHIPAARSLKEKRAVIRPILEGCRHRYRVAAAEVAHQEQWQRARLVMATVSAGPAHAGEVLDAVERFVWSFPDIEVTDTERRWMED
jgi:uncharacterized protein YlxP (DUF503 family)